MTEIAEMTTAEDIRGLVADVWTSFLAADDDAIELISSEPDPAIPSKGFVIASVSTTGAWNGHLVISVPSGCAEQIARAVFGEEDGDVPTEDVVDAVGEVSNILAGNLKSVLPQPSALSLPQAISDATTFFLPAVNLCLTATLCWNGQQFVVSLWQESASEGVEF